MTLRLKLLATKFGQCVFNKNAQAFQLFSLAFRRTDGHIGRDCFYSSKYLDKCVNITALNPTEHGIIGGSRAP
jgi:hypothetical protein